MMTDLGTRRARIYAERRWRYRQAVERFVQHGDIKRLELDHERITLVFALLLRMERHR
jgi:hypothetical protein